MECSYPYYFAYIVTEAVSNSIRSQADLLARWLDLFIDPQGQSIPEKVIIEKKTSEIKKGKAMIA